MSIDRYLYAGAYLALGKIKCSYEETVRGCSACRTMNKLTKFCSSCGKEHVDYQKRVETTDFDFFDLVSLDVDHGLISDEEEDNFFIQFMDHSSYIVPNVESSVGTTHSLDYSEFATSMPEYDEAAAKEFFQSVITVLERHGVKYEIKSGILFFCS